MASQRRAPTKRPPRPAAKKPTPPPSAEGTDFVERVTKTPAAGAAPLTKSPTGKAPTVPTSSKAPSSPTAKVASAANGAAGKPGAAAKAAPSGGVTKTNTGGGNYRPPTGNARTRRPAPPPKRKKPFFTKKTIGAIVALALIGSLVVFFSLAVNGSSGNPALNNALGPEQVPVPSGAALAAVDTARYPADIDGIKCNTTEQLKYHIHAHLAIFVDGQGRQIPAGIGIAPPQQYSTSGTGSFINGGSCFYWLHTHAADGILHIESPNSTIYTLGQAFDVWGQPLKAGQVGPALGKLTMYVNGKAYTGDPRAIPLNSHDVIQLDVGSSPPAPIAVSFPNGL
jgi:hypothetical protein